MSTIRAREPGWAEVLEDHAAEWTTARRLVGQLGACEAAALAFCRLLERWARGDAAPATAGQREAALCRAADRAETALAGLESPLGRYLLELLILFGLLARIRGGRLVRPIATWLGKAPVIGRMLQRASRAALERQNPELASAIRKLERAGAGRDPERAQKALSQLTAAERRAYFDAAGEYEAMPE